MAQITIRPAVRPDLEAITEIYNEAILGSTATFDIEPKTQQEQMLWFESHGPEYPILVAELEGRVVGWAALSQWSKRPAYRETAETSFYVKDGYRGRGVGRLLKEAIVEEGRRLGLHSLIARIAKGSSASLHLNERFGFKHVGVLKEVGRKFGKLIDVHIMQKIYHPGGGDAENASQPRPSVPPV